MGSSRNSADGFLMSSTPMLARFRSPPLTPRTDADPMNVSATLFRPSSLDDHRRHEKKNTHTHPESRKAFRVE